MITTVSVERTHDPPGDPSTTSPDRRHPVPAGPPFPHPRPLIDIGPPRRPFQRALASSLRTGESYYDGGNQGGTAVALVGWPYTHFFCVKYSFI